MEVFAGKFCELRLLTDLFLTFLNNVEFCEDF